MESVAIFEAEYNSKISLGVFLVNVKALRQRYPGDVAACCWNLFFSRRGAGAQRLFFKTIHAAGDSGSHDFFPEVQQVAERAAGQLQVRLNLLFVGRCHPFDRLVLCHPLRLRASAEVLSLSSLLRFQRGPSRTAR